MEVNLPTSGLTVRVTGAPPLQRHAVLSAHPLPSPPVIKIRRADGGYDDWPNEQDPAYRAERGAVLAERERALWEFYLLECLPDLEAPADWRESDAWQNLAWCGVPARPGPRGQRLDWLEFEVLRSPADEAALRQAFRRANEPSEEDRAEAEVFFDVCWNGIPVRQAAQGLPEGKLTFSSGFAQFKAASLWRLLPMMADEVPEDQRGRLPLLYYDLPPRLRARLEVFVEMDYYAQALQVHHAYRKT